MANIEKITRAQAVAHIVEAPAILTDRGVSVFGWEVSSPIQAALTHLDEAIEVLQGVTGAERHLAKAHSTYGDILIQNTQLRNPRLAAIQAYDKAIEVLGQICDYDGIEELARKKISLRQVNRS